MKKLLKGLLLLLAVFPFILKTKVFATEEITLFKSDVRLEQNTDINIREEIHYFFATPRRGIIREIPIKYKVEGGLQRPTRLVVNDIYYYKEDSPEQKLYDYERESKSGYAILRIGNPDVTITDGYVYVIDYKLVNAVNYFDEYDELFLNLTGSGWNVPIVEAYANIEVPNKITDKVCFTGPDGSTLSECTFEEIDENKVKLSVNSSLSSYEGYTVALKMPKGTLDDTRARQTVQFLLANIGLLLPIPIFFFLSSIVKKKGTNKKKTVIAHYEPIKGITPLFAGFLYKKVLENRHVTAEIIQMAIDGHIKIKQEGKREYILEKQSQQALEIDDASNLILLDIFKKGDSVNTKKIHSDFYLTVRDINRKLSDKAFELKYFDQNRRKLQSSLSSLGIIGVFLSFMSLGVFLEYALTGWSFGLGISSILALIFSFKVDFRGEKGNDIYHELEGLKLYINTAEKHRIDFHNNPEKFRGVFEKLLPYAIIFGLEKKWANEFKDIYTEPPSWYEGDVTGFDSYVLTNSLLNMGKNVENKAKPPNSAGGFTSTHGGSGGSGFSGGSSGGGFGGGGGSSW